MTIYVIFDRQGNIVEAVRSIENFIECGNFIRHEGRDHGAGTLQDKNGRFSYSFASTQLED